MASTNPAGNDVFCELTGPNGQQAVPITYWDLWMVISLITHFDGDWDRLNAHFKNTGKKTHFLRDQMEGYQNHLQHLKQLLEMNALTANQVFAQVDPELLRKQKTKAKHRFIDFKPSSKARSYWMIYTPRMVLEQRSLRGFWHAFPISPAAYADLIAALYKPKGFYSENQSWALQRKLSHFLEKQEKRLGPAEQLALYRAFLTIVLEQMNHVDDSFGVIGNLYGDVLEGYIGQNRSVISTGVFWQDLLNLLIWEDYGFSDQYLPTVFSSLTEEEVPVAEKILQDEREELLWYDLEYQAEEALTLLGLLYTQQRILDRYIPMAQEMGTRAWQRITRMAEMAESQGQIELSLAVYEACFQPGMHERFLREKYEQLKAKYQQ